MPRIVNTRPTSVYWLFDMRPETVAVVGPQGHPFYCGKTVYDPGVRLRQHQSVARRYRRRLISTWINDCGVHVRTQIMEIVPAINDWTVRESFWILTIQTLYPGGANIAKGGAGTPGYIHKPESIAKMRAAAKNRSPETLAKIGKASANRAPGVYAQIGASQKGKIISIEHRAKLSVAGLGKKRSPETRAKMSAAAAKRAGTDEYRAKMRAALTGRVFSPETIAKMSAAQSARYQKIRDAHA